MKIKFSDIKISEVFAGSIPQERKMQECRQFYDTYGTLDRWIVINNNNYLIDGYIGYLVLKNAGYTEEVIEAKKSFKRREWWFRKPLRQEKRVAKYKHIPTIYVYGKHHEDGKEYVWRIPETKRELASGVVIGNKALVNTKHGNKVITVTRVDQLSECPVDGRVKKVIRW